MAIRDLYQVDAFTTELFAGNPAGVVLNAEGLDDQTMLSLANELNNSETAFVFPKQEGYDLEVRFFTPHEEVPLCGHATIAAHVVLYHATGNRTGTFLMKTKAGILPVEVQKEGDEVVVTLTQGPIAFGPLLSKKQTKTLIKGLGIQMEDLDDSLPIQIVSTGYGKVMIPLLRKSVLDTLSVDHVLLAKLSKEISCNGFYAFTFDAAQPGSLVSGRMFAPRSKIKEDPVTGNANGPLGAYLTRYGCLEKKRNGKSFSIVQGEAMGRKGGMQVQVYSSETEPVLVKISGKARIVFHATLDVLEV